MVFIRPATWRKIPKQDGSWLSDDGELVAESGYVRGLISDGLVEVVA